VSCVTREGGKWEWECSVLFLPITSTLGFIMPLPPMPSTCSIWDDFNPGDPHTTDVPCRVVPCLWGGRARSEAVAEVCPTHWIDLPAYSPVRGGLRLVGLNTTRLEFVTANATKIVVDGQNPFDEFMVLTVEHRYVGTEDEYMRAYCMLVNVPPIS